MDRGGGRAARAALLAAAALFAAPAHAELAVIAPVAAATGNDDAPKDDVYDDFAEGDFVVVLALTSVAGPYESRGAYEFDLAELAQAGAEGIDAATLRLPQSSAYKLGNYFYAMRVYGYAGDGATQLADFEIESGQVGTIPVDTAAAEYTLDVTDFVQERLAAGEIAGFNLVSNVSDMQVILHDDAVLHARLEVEFTPAPPLIPALPAGARLALAALLAGLGVGLRRRRSPRPRRVG